MSKLSVLSCASSRITIEYRDRALSDKDSRSRIPSVAYLIFVSLEVSSSNRTAYPTSFPTFVPLQITHKRRNKRTETQSVLLVMKHAL